MTTPMPAGAETELLQRISDLERRLASLEEARGLIDRYTEVAEGVIDGQNQQIEHIWSWIDGLTAQDAQLLEIISISSKGDQATIAEVKRRDELVGVILGSWQVRSNRTGGPGDE